ncbi:MAG: DUF192 domain-containing protein [Gaiellaceae bacterium]|nr:DUF192 domain-containing protein [Gaiellaceae bacterium]
MRARASDLLPLVAACLAVALLSLSDTGTASVPASLRLDGVPFRPELALTPEERARGLMGRARAPADGMLFVFPSDTRGAFWMKNTRVPLRIVFFDARGVRVRELRMAPCRADPCPLYDPRRSYRFALELPAGDRRPAARLGPLRELRRLVRLAR